MEAASADRALLLVLEEVTCSMGNLRAQVIDHHFSDHHPQDNDGKASGEEMESGRGGSPSRQYGQALVDYDNHGAGLQKIPEDGANPTAPPVGSTSNSPARANRKSTYRDSLRKSELLRNSMTFRGSIVEIDELHSADSLHNVNVSSVIPFYAPPFQRQRWGDTHVLPHVNWGDLFFDLFYVAAAYNLGSLLMSALTPELWFRGLMYFIGMFGSLYSIWLNKLIFDARFVVVDYAHRIVDMIRVCFLSLAVMHIKMFSIMSDETQVATFRFTLGLFLDSIVGLAQDLEILLVGRGDTQALRYSTKSYIYRYRLPLTLIYLAAMILSGVRFFRSELNNGSEYSSANDGEHRFMAEETARAKEGASYPAASTYEGSSYSSDYGWSLSDLPIVLCLIGYVCAQLSYFLYTSCWFKTRDHKKYSVPMNIDFTIHRLGEWIMLMLGESVLSLLIVDLADTQEYYMVAVLGVLSTMMMQTLHFESQPSHADEHALQRNKTAGVSFGLVIQVYSMALITIGVSYKVMLSVISAEAASSEYGDGHRYLADLASSFVSSSQRFLAGSYDVPDSITCILFSSSLTVALISLELMTLTHRGIRCNFERCQPHDTPDPKCKQHWNLPCILLTMVKVCLLLFAATLSLWIPEAGAITLAGLLIILAFVVIRIVGWGLWARDTGKCQAVDGANGADAGDFSGDDRDGQEPFPRHGVQS